MTVPLAVISMLVFTACAEQPLLKEDLATDRLRCEYLVDPLGIDERQPRLSWIVTSNQRGQKQTAYQIRVASSLERLFSGKADLWDSSKVDSDETVNIVYAGKSLTSRQQCFWQVRVWDKDGKASPWSSSAKWSMGLLNKKDWRSEWISFKDRSPLAASKKKVVLPPARYYRKEFNTRKSVQRATVYATALGIYELSLNGHRISDQMFTPGWSDYRKRAYYNTFDVTRFLQEGENALGAILADGWYSGYVGFGLLVGYGPNRCGRYFYGKTPALRLQIEIEYTDGTTETIATDPTWKTSQGPILEADMLMGEVYDARLEQPGWDCPDFDDEQWHNAIGAEENGSIKAQHYDRGGEREVELGFIEPRVLQAYPSVPIRPIEAIRPVEITEPNSGVYIFNMGQNFSGIVELKVRGSRGSRIQLRHGEMLHPDGRLMTANLRKARATDAYILKGNVEYEIWRPHFTYHGFQYVEVTGLTGKPALDTVTGIVLGSDTPLTSSFACSDPMVNQLFSNIVWTQRANFFEVPTDCPQRDERLGWTGDAQVYARAATYNADVAAFFTKWEHDLVESQRDNGAYPAYAPFPMQHGIRGKAYGPAWMDAGIICPYTIYKVYGDRRIIERNYDSMTRFMDFRRSMSPDFQGVFVGNDWGDWLALNKTPIEYIDAVYFAYSSKLMAKMARAIGRTKDAKKYDGWLTQIRAFFDKNYVNENGSLAVNTQTAYALALSVDMLPPEKRSLAGRHLAKLIEENDNLMSTGFLGTRSLLPALTASGHHDLAARLLQTRRYPSWGYEVENGATTVWERWNSYTKEGGFMNAGMNSFSHYSFGAVCEWIFQSLAGIDTDGPGYKHILFCPGPPIPGSSPNRQPIDWVSAEYDSVRGRIVSRWRRDENRFHLTVTIPANTAAVVYLPANEHAVITESGNDLEQVKEVQFLKHEGDHVVLSVASGNYRFVVEERRTAEEAEGSRRVKNGLHASTNESQPNVLFIAVDDLNNWIGCMGGHPQTKTPNLDRLAERGVLFSNAYCQAPICNPSRISLLTGLSPSSTGIYYLSPRIREWEATKDAVTIPQHFERNGYSTFGAGKIYHTEGEGEFGEYGGNFGGFGPYPSENISCNHVHPLWDWGAFPEKDEDMPDAKIASWSVGKLRQPHHRPFFLAVGFYRPHVPMYAPQPWFDRHPLDQVQLPAHIEDDLNDIPKYGQDLSWSAVAPRHQWIVEHDEWKHAVQSYLASVSFVDAQVGKVLNALDASGQADKTIIVLWSDNGFHLGTKERWSKRSLWEAATKVPLIICAPGLAKGVVCDRPVGLIDLYPTLIELCGLWPRTGLEGHSLVPLLENPEATWQWPTITTFGQHNHAVRSQHWRYIVYVDGSEELYDHRRDRNEFRNLAGDEKFQQVIQRLRRSLPQLNQPMAPGSSHADARPGSAPDIDGPPKFPKSK